MFISKQAVLATVNTCSVPVGCSWKWLVEEAESENKTFHLSLTFTNIAYTQLLFTTFF